MYRYIFFILFLVGQFTLQSQDPPCASCPIQLSIDDCCVVQVYEYKNKTYHYFDRVVQLNCNNGLAVLQNDNETYYLSKSNVSLPNFADGAAFCDFFKECEGCSTGPIEIAGPIEVVITNGPIDVAVDFSDLIDWLADNELNVDVDFGELTDWLAANELSIDFSDLTDWLSENALDVNVDFGELLDWFNENELSVVITGGLEDVLTCLEDIKGILNDGIDVNITNDNLNVTITNESIAVDVDFSDLIDWLGANDLNVDFSDLTDWLAANDLSVDFSDLTDWLGENAIDVNVDFTDLIDWMANNEIDVNITGGLEDVVKCLDSLKTILNGELDVNITNDELVVTISNEPLEVTITNEPLDVTVDFSELTDWLGDNELTVNFDELLDWLSDNELTVDFSELTDWLGENPLDVNVDFSELTDWLSDNALDVNITGGLEEILECLEQLKEKPDGINVLCFVDKEGNPMIIKELCFAGKPSIYQNDQGETTSIDGLSECPNKVIKEEELCYHGYEHFYDNTTPSLGACGFVSANYALNPNESEFVSFENSCDIYDPFAGEVVTGTSLNGYFDAMNTLLTDLTDDTWVWSLDVPNKCWRYFTTISKDNCYGTWNKLYKGKPVTIVPRVKYATCSIIKRTCQYKDDDGNIIVEAVQWFDMNDNDITGDVMQYIIDCTGFNPLTVEKVYETEENLIKCFTTDCTYRGVKDIENPCTQNGTEFLCADEIGGGIPLTLYWSICDGIYSQSIYTSASVSLDPTEWVEYDGGFIYCDGSEWVEPTDETKDCEIPIKECTDACGKSAVLAWCGRPNNTVSHSYGGITGATLEEFNTNWIAAGHKTWIADDTGTGGGECHWFCPSFNTPFLIDGVDVSIDNKNYKVVSPNPNAEALGCIGEDAVHVTLCEADIQAIADAIAANEGITCKSKIASCKDGKPVWIREYSDGSVTVTDDDTGVDDWCVTCIECEEETTNEKCSIYDAEYVFVDNTTDIDFSSNNTSLKWNINSGSNTAGAIAFTNSVRACIDAGGSAKILHYDSNGVEFHFVATGYSGTVAVGSQSVFTGTGVVAGSGKLTKATIECSCE